MTRAKLVATLFLLTFSLTAIAQKKQAASSIQQGSTDIQFKQKDTSYWIINFRQFRDALYQRNLSKAKSFFDFPFKNEGNDIWYLAFSGNDKAIDNLDSNVKPFTEYDFDKYFDKIFSKDLIKCFLKIKMDELYKTGKSESPEFKDSSTTYKLYVTYDHTVKILQLNLATRTPYKISDTEYEAGESNFIYQFQVLKNGHIKLKRLLIAE